MPKSALTKISSRSFHSASSTGRRASAIVSSCAKASRDPTKLAFSLRNQLTGQSRSRAAGSGLVGLVGFGRNRFGKPGTKTRHQHKRARPIEIQDEIPYFAARVLGRDHRLAIAAQLRNKARGMG